jgi:hypothetical protein
MQVTVYEPCRNVMLLLVGTNKYSVLRLNRARQTRWRLADVSWWTCGVACKPVDDRGWLVDH